MAFEPNKITREHVLDAVKEIEENSIALAPSTQWDVIIADKAYPPVDILRYAHKQMNGELLWKSSSEEATNSYLDEMGFLIRAKNSSAEQIRAIIQQYKQTFDLSEFTNKDEKWGFVQRYKHSLDPSSTGFVEALNRVKFTNFLYPIASAVIKELLSSEPVRYQQCFINLFREDKDLSERIQRFMQEVQVIYRGLHPEHNGSCHHDERTTASLLTIQNPERYTFYMDTFYRNLCTLMGIKPKSTKGFKS